MADVDTQMLVSQHADIRREGAEHTAEIRYDMATKAGDIRREVAQGFDKTGDLVNATASDIRLEQAEQAATIRQQNADRTAELRYEIGQGVNEVVKEGLKGDFNTVGAIKDSRYETVSRVEANGDRLHNAVTDANFNLSSRVENAQDRNARDIGELRGTMADRFYGVGRDLSMLMQGHATLSKDIELNALKGQIEGQRNTQYLADKIVADGEKTRGLIQDLKYHDLNRSLVERNAELIEERHYGHHWRHQADQNQFQGQWAALQSQVQAFASQLQETRQGMVNFGTMAGVGMSSTSNNVR